MKKELGLLTMIVVVCVAAGIKNPQFVTSQNIQNLTNLIGMYGIFSIGLGMVIITGGIDLSVGSMFALLGILMADMLVDWGCPWWLGVVGVIACGTFLGSVHGFLITKVRMQPFVVTLCGLLIYRGVARYIAGDGTKGFGSYEGFGILEKIATGNVYAAGLAIPKTFILLMIVSAVMWVVLHRSVYGRYLYAVGKNEDAARFSGINSKLIIGSAYALCGALAGVSAILIACYTNSVSPSSHGNFYELFGIAAAVLGGCSLRGGEGSILGIILGTILIQILQNLVNILGIPSSLNFAVLGTVILLGVLSDQIIKDYKGRKVAVAAK